LRITERAANARKMSPAPERNIRSAHLTRLERPAMMFVMPDRRLRIVRFIGSTPNTAYCDVCKLAFRTRRELITDADKAKAQLQSDFEKHECRPEEGAVDDALDHIR
jgi:hypothetical protein